MRPSRWVEAIWRNVAMWEPLIRRCVLGGKGGWGVGVFVFVCSFFVFSVVLEVFGCDGKFWFMAYFFGVCRCR